MGEKSGTVRFEPELSLNSGERIIIYGAGEYGKSTYNYIRKMPDINITAWVDRKYKELGNGVLSPKNVFMRDDYDKIIIALKDSNTAEEVRQYYINGGVSPLKIVWIGLPWIYDDVSSDIRERYENLNFAPWKNLHGVSEEFDIGQPYSTTSMICNQAFLDMPFAKYWSKKLSSDGFPTYHRKRWEDVYICQALYERGYLKDGKKGVGFGVGEEPLPDLFASYGCHILATDLSRDAAEAKGWIETGQNSGGDMSKLRKRHLCDDREFYDRVEYRDVDMNNIPKRIRGYDFCWSTCALEHLGSLKHGANFIINSMEVLAKGGVAVHTTEYNLYSDDETIESEGLSLYRKKDILEAVDRLEKSGYEVEPFDWFTGDTIYDGFVDLPPYSEKSLHLRFLIDRFPCTSIGIIVHKR